MFSTELPRARMITYIDFLEQVHQDNRNEAQLTAAEIAQLEAFISVEHDKPTYWASHLLCYNYGICRSPYTGDAGAEPKALVRRPTKADAKLVPVLTLKPNPANAWVVVTYDAKDARGGLRLLVRDALGRQVHQEQAPASSGQVLIDSRGFPAGAYMVELFSDAAMVASERLIVQP